MIPKWEPLAIITECHANPECSETAAFRELFIFCCRHRSTTRAQARLLAVGNRQASFIRGNGLSWRIIPHINMPHVLPFSAALVAYVQHPQHDSIQCDNTVNEEGWTPKILVWYGNVIGRRAHTRYFAHVTKILRYPRWRP